MLTLMPNMSSPEITQGFDILMLMLMSRPSSIAHKLLMLLLLLILESLVGNRLYLKFTKTSAIKLKGALLRLYLQQYNWGGGGRRHLIPHVFDNSKMLHVYWQGSSKTSSLSQWILRSQVGCGNL